MKPQSPLSATAALRGWLASLKEESLDPDVRIGLVDGLALTHRATIKRMLDDVEVQEAIDRVCELENHNVPREDKLYIVKSMLVDACWMGDFRKPPRKSTRSKPTPQNSITRTEKIRSLLRAAEKAQKLSKEILSLTPLTGHNLTVSHLQNRLAAGNEPWFIKNRKGWHARRSQPDRSIPDLLEMLTSELVEEAALIKINIDRTAQPGHQRHPLTSIADALFRQSIKLGALTTTGEPCPDFQLVHAVLTSVFPDQAPDESTLRKIWRRKGQPKSKPS